jgi:hypothetical protein
MRTMVYVILAAYAGWLGSMWWHAPSTTRPPLTSVTTNCGGGVTSSGIKWSLEGCDHGEE